MRGRSSLPFIGVAAAGVFGAWLMGMFESGEPAVEVTGRDNLVSLAGFLIFLGSLVAGGFLMRRALPPITRAEMVAWGPVREQGRRRFIRKSLARGLFTGLLSVGGVIVWNHLRGEPLTGNLFVYALLLLIIVFGVWYAAVRDWAVNEAAYQKLVGGAAAADATRD
jgi:hypothetical protein